VPLLVSQTVATWLIAEAYLRYPSRAWIVLGVAANLAVLAFFKYLAFVAGAVVGIMGVPVQGWDLILPLGISFYTFELISYLVDLRRGDGPHYKLRKFCLFIFLFPHLIAGPIIRHNEIIPQFSLSPFRPGLSKRFAYGIAFFVIGCVKKVFIADPLAGVADPILRLGPESRIRRCVARRAGLYLPAVPRLLRLFGDGDRARADARLPVPR
jgi:D-alanyl-lipoteichoic acid acyltransferase DltB (MBOAT superfamily)